MRRDGAKSYSPTERWGMCLWADCTETMYGDTNPGPESQFPKVEKRPRLERIYRPNPLRRRVWMKADTPVEIGK